MSTFEALQRREKLPTNETILALDLGTTTGCAVAHRLQRNSNPAPSFRPSRYEGGGMRYLRFTDWLVETAMLSGGINRLVL